MRPCCKFQRDSNDALYDDVDKRWYCAECWQKWVIANKKKVDTKSLQSQSSPPAKSANSDKNDNDDDDDDGNIETLDGIVHTDGNLYLVDRKKGAVYNCERDSAGELVQAGVLQSDSTIKLHTPKKLPFEVDASDNCETPQEAYDDIAPMLRALASNLKKPPSDLIIYDPYYCDGGVKTKLGRLGFARVYNEPVDFYTSKTPQHDVVVTNPPYSGDHMERMFEWLVKNSKPWFLVLPNFVYMKAYYQQLPVSPFPFYLTPSSPRRYVYVTPVGMRDVKSAHRKTSPFISFWYCWAGQRNSSLFRWYANNRDNDDLTLCCNLRALPNEFKDSNDSTRRKKRKNKSNSSTMNDNAKRNLEQTPGTTGNGQPKRKLVKSNHVSRVKNNWATVDNKNESNSRNRKENSTDDVSLVDAKKKKKQRILVTDDKDVTKNETQNKLALPDSRRNECSKKDSSEIKNAAAKWNRQNEEKAERKKRKQMKRLARVGMK